MGLSCRSILYGTLALRSIGEYILYDYVCLPKRMSDDRPYLFSKASIYIILSHCELRVNPWLPSLANHCVGAIIK